MELQKKNLNFFQLILATFNPNKNLALLKNNLGKLYYFNLVLLVLIVIGIGYSNNLSISFGSFFAFIYLYTTNEHRSFIKYSLPTKQLDTFTKFCGFVLTFNGTLLIIAGSVMPFSILFFEKNFEITMLIIIPIGLVFALCGWLMYMYKFVISKHNNYLIVHQNMESLVAENEIESRYKKELE
jgi:hypothetical protein